MLGFVGIVIKECWVWVVGLIVLVGDEFGNGFWMLMVLGIWE